MLLPEVVAEDDGVIQGEGQLQNAGDGVGHEGNRAQQEVAALVQDHGDDKGQQQHRHFAVGLAGEQQYHHHNDRHVEP